MSLNRLHKAEVLSHTSAGRGYYRLVLKAPGAAAAAVPGQFVMLRVSGNRDPLLARPFGISSVTSRSSIELVYRVAGRGTTLLTGAETGHTLNLLGPLGTGFPLPNKECLPPPIILKSFKDVVAGMHIATEDGSAGTRGMSTDILNTFLSKQEKKSHLALYACGPRAMLVAVSRVAEEHSIPCYVSLEERMACGLGACMGCAVGMKAGGYKRVCKEGPVFDSREIDWSSQVMLPIRSIKR